MNMSLWQSLVTIGMVILGTVITRFLPFLLFPADKPTPPFIAYLGKVLPAAALGLLVIYSIKDYSLLSGWHALPEFIAAAATVLLHVWKRQMLISIAGGTILYMLLIQFVFV